MPPVDPERTTAKPAMQLIVPPNQAFTDELLVGVYAAANCRGSMLDNMGLERVRAVYEGNAVDIASPSVQSFVDANGQAVTYFGWWLRLRHDGRHGIAHLYFEALPKDPAMQHRTMGPYTFLPSPELFDIDLEVAHSPPEVGLSAWRYR